MADRSTNIAQRERRPFALLDRFADEMDRVFDDFGFGRGGFAPRPWRPQVEVYQRNNELVVRADLPGMKKDDVTLEITDNDLTISGERRQEQETERDGVYRSERSYGTFHRTIALPEGAITDQAKASFKDGVLEITIPAPPQSTKGRRLEIRDGSESHKPEVKSQK